MKYNDDYGDLTDEYKEYMKLTLLADIANELAEANRLKRLEMKGRIACDKNEWDLDDNA